MGSSKRPNERLRPKLSSRKSAGENSKSENDWQAEGPKLRDVSDFTSIEEFLAEEGVLEEVTARAVKRVIALQLRRAMMEEELSKVAVANRMGTSRRQLDRVLDDEGHDAISIETLARAAKAVGKKLKVELV